MLKKSLILIALLFIIASIPARAESLQELINRHKELALINAKIKMQELIADTLEMKKYRMYKPEYRNIDNFDYYYQAQLDLNNNAFYYDDTTSIYSILDTTRIALDRIYVLDKRHNEILNLCDEREQFLHNMRYLDPVTGKVMYDESEGKTKLMTWAQGKANEFLQDNNWYALGELAHPLTDKYCPRHRSWQIWNPNSYLDMIEHVVFGDLETNGQAHQDAVNSVINLLNS